MIGCDRNQQSDGEIIWRIMLFGAGFGLFQSPNNNTIITWAPRNRSGMLGTARLFGQPAVSPWSR